MRCWRPLVFAALTLLLAQSARGTSLTVLEVTLLETRSSYSFSGRTIDPISSLSQHKSNYDEDSATPSPGSPSATTSIVTASHLQGFYGVVATSSTSALSVIDPTEIRLQSQGAAELTQLPSAIYTNVYAHTYASTALSMKFEVDEPVTLTVSLAATLVGADSTASLRLLSLTPATTLVYLSGPGSQTAQEILYPGKIYKLTTSFSAEAHWTPYVAFPRPRSHDGLALLQLSAAPDPLPPPPFPEPGTSALLLLSVVPLAVRRRRGV